MKLEVIASDELKRFGLPSFATSGSAAIDLRALLNTPKSRAKLVGETVDYDTTGRATRLRLAPGKQIMIDSGLRIHIADPSLCALILPRSGSGSKGLVLGNGTGLIDSDYQGPLMMVLWNRSDDVIMIEDGDRVAQYLVTNVIQFGFDFVDSFSAGSERSEGGFGSTGNK